MITAHQNRIEDLRESFRRKMSEADQWPQKVRRYGKIRLLKWAILVTQVRWVWCELNNI